MSYWRDNKHYHDKHRIYMNHCGIVSDNDDNENCSDKDQNNNYIDDNNCYNNDMRQNVLERNRFQLNLYSLKKNTN